MGKIISIANQKGGVGKTTTSVSLSAILAKKGKKILMIDMDPQGNGTSGLGIDKNVKFSVYDVIIDDVEIENTIKKTEIENLDVCPSNINLAGAEVELVDMEEREQRLKSKLDKIKEKYDYIIIDCPPSLGLVTLNAFTASDSVLIPVQCEYYALEGLGQLINTINLVKKHLNKSLYIEGALLTMYDARTNLSNQVVKEVKRYFEDKVYKVVIPRNVKLSEAPSYGMPITLYDKRSKGAKCYEKLAKEFLKINDSEQKAKHMKEWNGRKLINIEPNRDQPRRTFDEESIGELAESIKKYGLIQPIVVTKKDDYYQIIAGERRWRASKKAGLIEVPCIIREEDERKNKEIALIENIQRQDLNPIEKAKGFKQLMDDYGMTQMQLSEAIGISRSAVANTVRILNLDPRVIDLALQGRKLTEGHCRSLMSIIDGERQYQMALQIIETGDSVRDIERKVKNTKQLKKKDQKYEAIFKDIEQSFSGFFGSPVKLNAGKRKGKIIIEYSSNEDLERLLDLIK